MEEGRAGQMTIDLPQLSVDERLDRAVRNLTGSFLGAIAFAKSMGKSAEDYGQFYGELTWPFWASIKDAGPGPFVQNLARFLRTDPALHVEILEASDTEVKGMATVYGSTHLENFEDLGATVEEYVAYWRSYWGILAERLGLSYEQAFEGSLITFSVARKQ